MKMKINVFIVVFMVKKTYNRTIIFCDTMMFQTYLIII